MKRYLVLSMLAVVGLTMLLSMSVTITAFAPNNEEYMVQHDGGDRAAYLQEMEHSDPSFYVPPTN
jgi:hypothetical protein